MKLVSLFLLLASLHLVNCQSAIFLAVLVPTASNNGSGTFVVSSDDSGDLIGVLDFCGLVPLSTHGIHVHQYGDITASDGTAAGEHFNPYNVPHACTGVRHVGDLGNFTVGVDGCVYQNFTFEASASTYPSDLGFLLGHAVIIHASHDDCVTQPTGNSGARIAQGVLGLAKGAVLPPGNSTTQTVVRAVALLQPTTYATSSILGNIIFTPSASGVGVDVSLYIVGLLPWSTHGIHIHQYGDISYPNGTAAGEHFNPYNVPHACVSPKHTGDMGNFTADGNGVIQATYWNSNASLVIDSFNSIIGLAVIVHASPDDCVSQPTGNSGSRIAQGVIGITQVATVNPSAIAVFEPTSAGPAATGTAVLTVMNLGTTPGVNVFVKVSGLAANTGYGLSVRTYGDLTSADGSTAGPIFTSGTGSHGCPPNPRLLGDLGNVFSDAYGNVYANVFTNLLSLNPNSGYYVLGHSIQIFANQDDCTSATGGLGAPILQGVIGYQLNSITIPTTGSPVFNNLQAVCTMKGTAGNTVSGNVTFTGNEQGGLRVYVYISGITANTVHGFHVHAFGDISYANGTAAGEHFNPYNTSHACPPTISRHSGDIGNITANSDGNVYILLYQANATLAVINPASIIGRAMIIHASYDDCVTQPTGNSGARIAQCTIGWTSVATRYDPGVPTGSPSTPVPTPHSSASSLSSSITLFLFSLFISISLFI